MMGGLSNTQAVPLKFFAINRAPAVSIAPLTTVEDIELVGRIAANDPDGDTVTIVLVSLPTVGTLKQFDGTPITSLPAALTDPKFQFRFLPALHAFASPYATFVFYGDDGSGAANSQSAQAAATISVTFFNYPPVANPSTVYIPEESSAIAVLLNVTDVETQLATVATIISLPASSAGILTDVSGNVLFAGSTISSPWSIQFTPTPLFVGVTSFQFKANDGTQDSNMAGTMTINVTNVNLPPISQVYLGTAIRAVSFPITFAASDPNLGDTLTFTITDYAGLGKFGYPDISKRGVFPITVPFNLPYALTVGPSRSVSTVLNYLAPEGASGNNYANISFYATDQTGLSSAVTTAQINIGANNPPTANAVGTIVVTQDFMSAPIPLSGSDIDVADALNLNVILLSLPSKGTLFFMNGTAITSAPVPLTITSIVAITYLTNQRGSDSFSFTVQDLLGVQSTPVTVFIAITNTNHPPTAQWLGSSVGDEDTVVSITQMGATDPDSDDTSFTYFIASAPNKGTITQMDGSSCASYPCQVTSSGMLFTPAKDDNGSPYATFTFYAVDYHGARSTNTATGTISINSVNDPPMTYPTTASGLENSNLIVSLNVTDVDTPASGLSVVVVSLPSASLGYLTTQAGVVLKAGDVVALQNLNFVPVQYANGASSFSFQASDGQSYSNVASCTINVISVTQAPDCSLSVPSPILVSRLSTTKFNLLSVDHDQGETYTFYLLSYTQSADKSGVLSGSAGTLTASTTVIGTATSAGTYTPYPLTYTVTSTISSLNITFLVYDGTFNSSQCVLQLLMTDNMPPVADDPSPVTTKEEMMSGNIAMTGTDPDDSRPVRVIIVSLPQNGLLYLNPNTPIQQTGPLPAGAYGATYMPTGLFYGSDSYQYVISDANGMNSAVQTVSITVQHINHLPTVTAGAMNGRENTPLNITQIFANDVDGDTLTLVITSAPSNGTFTRFDGTLITSYPISISAPFQFTFLPTQYAYGPVTFPFYVTDGTDNTAAMTAIINVAFVNIAPVAQNTSLSLLENAAATNFTLSISDVDSPQQNLVVRILSLPSSSFGTVTTPDGQSVSVGQFISSPRILTFTPAQYSYGNASVIFAARDEALYSTTNGAVSILITHANHAPQVSASSNVVATRGVQLAIPLYITDKDSGDFLKFTLASVASGGGVLSNSSSGSPITTNNYVFGSGYITSSGASLTPSLYYTAPANAAGDNYAIFTFFATDQTDSSSAPFAVSVSIAYNNPPTANSASISVTQDQSSAPITLSGNDADVADAGSLKTYINALPTKGVITVGGLNLTSAPALVTGPISYSTNERGQDSLSFQVVDNVGGTSAIQIVPISITSVNHPPVVKYSGSGVSIQENARATINQISTFDADGDKVTIYVSTLPTLGALYQLDSTPITAPNTPITDSSNRFIYVPAGAEQSNQATSFSVYGSDGQWVSNSNTSVITISVSIIHVNRPPVASPSSILAAYGTASAAVTPNVTDSDSPTSSLSITIQSLPDSWATLTYNSNLVAIGDVIPYPFNNMELTFAMNAHGYTTFTFSASDGQATSTSYGTFAIAINSLVNSPPTASAPPSYTATRGLPLAISLGAHDDDFLQTFTYSVAVQSAGGAFSVSSGAVLAPPSFTIRMAQDQNLYTTNAVLEFTAPALAAGSDFLIVNFTVSDGVDTSNSVGIAIGIAPNNPPIASFNGTIIFYEEGQSDVFVIGGTDPDPADANNLNVTITALPTKGTLWLVGTGPIISIGGAYANATFYILGGPLQYDDDTFSYAVVDNLGAISAPLQVPITITHVNHAPTGGAYIPEGAMNQPLIIQIYGQDVDSDSVLAYYITQLPAPGQLTQSDGTVITSASPSRPVLVSSASGKVIYIPPTDVYGTNISTIGFFVADNSYTNNRSNVAYGSINVKQGDLPPTAYSSDVAVPDGISVTIPLNATDPQGYPLQATIVQFPTSGTLYRSDNTTITPSNPTVGSDRSVIYVPIKGSYGQNYTFSYQVTSTTSSLTSNTGTVTASVYRVYNAPVYIGQTEFSIPENSPAYILFSATSEAPSYQVKILTTTSKGTLTFVTDDQQIDITGLAPYLMNNPDSENRAKYLPPLNTSGIDLVYLTIQVVDIYGASLPVNINISVYHINVGPSVVPTTYVVQGQTYNWTGTVTIPENQCTAVAWDIYDSDSPRSNLSSLITSLPFRGQLYQRNADGSTGVVINGQVTVPVSADGFYRVIYCPEQGKSGNNFASFSVIGSDSIANSDRRYVNFKVIHTNQAPQVKVSQHEWNTTVNSDLLITGVSIADVDARIYSVRVILTLAYDGAPGVSQNATAISLFNHDNSICSTTAKSVVCTATVDKLNQMLTQISLEGQEETGLYTINVFVDDMGDGTGIDAKNASDTVRVTASPVDKPRKPGNNNVLTAAVASAAVVGAAAAAGVYGYMRKRSPPTSTFFGLEQGLANGVINENPLYEGGLVMENTIYRAPTFGMQKL